MAIVNGKQIEGKPAMNDEGDFVIKHADGSETSGADLLFKRQAEPRSEEPMFWYDRKFKDANTPNEVFDVLYAELCASANHLRKLWHDPDIDVDEVVWYGVKGDIGRLMEGAERRVGQLIENEGKPKSMSMQELADYVKTASAAKSFEELLDDEKLFPDGIPEDRREEYRTLYESVKQNFASLGDDNG